MCSPVDERYSCVYICLSIRIIYNRQQSDTFRLIMCCEWEAAGYGMVAAHCHRGLYNSSWDRISRSGDDRHQTAGLTMAVTADTTACQRYYNT